MLLLEMRASVGRKENRNSKFKVLSRKETFDSYKFPLLLMRSLIGTRVYFDFSIEFLTETNLAEFSMVFRYTLDDGGSYDKIFG